LITGSGVSKRGWKAWSNIRIFFVIDDFAIVEQHKIKKSNKASCEQPSLNLPQFMKQAARRRSVVTILPARSALALGRARPAYGRSIICRLIVQRDCAGEVVWPGSGVRDRALFACMRRMRRRRTRRRGRRCRIATGVKLPTSPFAVRRVAISRVRLGESTQQLSIIAGNREHNRRNAKSAKSGAEPKHSHRKTPLEFWPFRLW